MAKKILVIDDEPEMLSLVKYTLEQAGFEVHTCDNGRTAWDEIGKVRPDVLILDVMLPGIDGYSLQLKMSQDASTKDLPIVILTALEPSRTLFQKLPSVVGFMTKPFKTEELLKTVQSAAEGRGSGA
jgi:two-component system phosphate regulon response regulator PhoB